MRTFIKTEHRLARAYDRPGAILPYAFFYLGEAKDFALPGDALLKIRNGKIEVVQMFDGFHDVSPFC